MWVDDVRRHFAGTDQLTDQLDHIEDLLAAPASRFDAPDRQAQIRAAGG